MVIGKIKCSIHLYSSPWLRYVTIEGMYEAINKIHEAQMHTGRRLGYPAIKAQYANITQEHLQIFINCCQHCQTKNKGGTKKGLVVIISSLFLECISRRAAGMYEDLRTGPHHVFRI